MEVELEGDGSLIARLEDIKGRWFSESTTIVVADTSYAVYVEFGTYLMSAQPYLRPAIEAAEARASSIADDADSADEFSSMMADECADIARTIVPVDTGYLKSHISVIEGGATPPEPSWADETLQGAGDAGPDDYEGEFDGPNG
jgi:hypothetical protein